MADHNDCASIFSQHLLQKIEGFQIEIIGGFIQNQKVGRPCQFPRQNQSRPFAARENRYRCSRLFRAKQEIPHISHHMFGFTVDGD